MDTKQSRGWSDKSLFGEKSQLCGPFFTPYREVPISLNFFLVISSHPIRGQPVFCLTLDGRCKERSMAVYHPSYTERVSAPKYLLKYWYVSGVDNLLLLMFSPFIEESSLVLTRRSILFFCNTKNSIHKF